MRAPRCTAHVRGASALALAAVIGAVAAALLGCMPTAQGLPPADLQCYGPGCVPLNVGAAVTTAPLVDCAAAEQGVEFAPFNVLDNETGAAQYFYQYVDGTAGLTPSGYGPTALAQNRCLPGTDPGSSVYVYHTSGGPFTGWGGGLGIGLEHLAQDSHLCTGTPLPAYCPPAGAGAAAGAINFAALDVSQWDGISLWARRGPNGQPLMRVLVGDKYTDDDISYLMYIGDPTEKRFCERKADCGCNYQDTTCSFYSGSDPVYGHTVTKDQNNPDPNDPTNRNSDGSLYCGAPKSHPASASQNSMSSNGVSCPDGVDCASNFCGNSVCDEPYAAYATNGPDAEWVNKPCTPYTYRNGTVGNICYDPATDPPPPESDEQCGDHFTFPLNLTTDWKFYKIPFATMFQQGWAKQAPTFDLTSVSVVRFTWDVGYIDYYIDNVRFYKASSPATP